MGKQGELTGKSLELHTPSYHRNVDNGQTNYLGMVKEMKIGQSAAKFLNIVVITRYESSSTTRV